jgi:hypothetical protein
MVVGGLSTPAAADPASYGWSDNHQICKFTTGCLRTGNLVRLWQSILWADEEFASSSNIDGEFGPNTHTWTVQWQDEHMDGDLSGKVGPNTWGTAYGMLEVGACAADNYAYGEYPGPYNRVIFLRMHCGNGSWYFVNPRTGLWTDTNH